MWYDQERQGPSMHQPSISKNKSYLSRLVIVEGFVLIVSDGDDTTFAGFSPLLFLTTFILIVMIK
jgi:hypothetical protein